MLAPNPNTKPPTGQSTRPRRAGREVQAVLWDGTVKGTFPSAAEAADAVGVYRNTIYTAVVRGHRSCGYWWRYADTDAASQPLVWPTFPSPRRPIPEQYRTKPEPVTVVASPRGTVVRGVALRPAPTRHRNARLGECVDTETIDSVGTIDVTEPVAETLNPGRAGHEASSYERGRFDRARQFNPLLTWEHWVEITTKQPRGRKPKPRPNTETR